MRRWIKETELYGVLLIILFAIAAIAVRSTVSYIEEQVYGIIDESSMGVIVIAVWSLTLGFMLIAGAFALLTIHFSGRAESRRRVSQMVEAMDYLSDGLVAMDNKGNITGANPAARAMLSPGFPARTALADIFPSIEPADISLLMDSTAPSEAQCGHVQGDNVRTIRLRSQPLGWVTLLLISDVTSINACRAREQQAARLQLVGRIAQGVAHDLDRIFGVISGHASVINRLKPGAPEAGRSVASILRETERGVQIARQVLQFSQASISPGMPTDRVGEHVERAAALLRIVLSPEWQVETAADTGIPLVSLSGEQLEQAVLNLGLVAADAVGMRGAARITASAPREDHLRNVGNQFAAVILVSATPLSAGAQQAPPETSIPSIPEEGGMILSVVRSVLEDAGGSLDCLHGTDGSRIYRMVLPRGIRLETAGEEVPEELLKQVAGWHVLLATGSAGHYRELEEHLQRLGARVERSNSVVSMLARIESGTAVEAIILDRCLVEPATEGLFRALAKLCPSTGIVVVSEAPASEAKHAPPSIVFEQWQAPPARIIRSMMEARSLTRKRS